MAISKKEASAIRDAVSDVNRAAGSLMHAAGQMELYPTSPNSQAWYDAKLAEFTKYHDKYETLLMEATQAEARRRASK